MLSKPLKDSVVLDLLDNDHKKSPWIDAMKCRVLLRRRALPELIAWINNIEQEEGI